MPKKSEKFRVKMLIAQPTNLNISKANFGFAQELSPEGRVWKKAGGGGMSEIGSKKSHMSSGYFQFT